MELNRCPVCGGAAVVVHMFDTYDRADYGWDAGCGRAKLNDGIHPDVSKVEVKGLGSKEAAIEAWNRRFNESAD